MMTETTMYARMYGGKRLHIVTGVHSGVYVATCGAAPGTTSKGYVNPGWYSGQNNESPYYPICKACRRSEVAATPT